MQVLYWCLAILLLGVLVMLHELGHFLSARAVGIRVMEFAIGFGPKLWSHTGKDGVKYSLRALPLGGYCQFYGEDENKGDDPDALSKQKVWKRFFSVISGPLMNFIAAILALFVLYAVVGFPGPSIPQVGSITKGMPAETAGLLPGDRFVTVNGLPVDTVDVIIEEIGRVPGAPVEVVVARGDTEKTFTMQPYLDETEQRWMIGIVFANQIMRLNVWESLEYAVKATGNVVGMMGQFLRDLVTKGQGLDDIAGPIGTLDLIQQETQTGGIRSFLSLAALISVNLGFFNLLPIPGLDGSRLIFLVVEAIRRKPIDPNKEGMVHLVGFVLLIGVMVLVLFKDVMRLFGA